jgi:signal transduction histidine kinase
MLKRLSLRTQLLTAGIVLTALPMLVTVAWTSIQSAQTADETARESTTLALSNLDHISRGVYNMCATQHEMLMEHLQASLNVARNEIKAAGGIHLDSDRSVDWQAVNQFTKRSETIELPPMEVGETWLGQYHDFTQRTPVIDKVGDLVGGTCTIFQRMNEQGDMLRVATNVKKLDGDRAIGTYIPAVHEGKPNAVIATVLRGETYLGRAYVVNAWYLTAYEPIQDAQGRVIGVLYFGVPQESVVALREAIMDTTVGQTGYVFVLDSEGHYVVSKGGQRDGERIWDARDADGRLFIQEICKTAVELEPDESVEFRYPWSNDPDNPPRQKISRLMYFEPWDWIIGAGSYEEEFLGVSNRVQAAGRSMQRMVLLVAVVAILVAAGVWYLLARTINRRILSVVEQLRMAAGETANSSEHVAQASQSLASGTSQQAASLEQTSASLEELTASTRTNTDNAHHANTLSEETTTDAAAGTEAMQRMNTAIEDIRSRSDETYKIIKTIDDIAFQTNLLALNAAVEAARAGEAGKGFAVVAEEVRNLAQRSAEAAQSTTDMIKASVDSSQRGADICSDVNRALEKIAAGATKVNALIAGIATSSEQQSSGIEQINAAVTQMDSVTQSNAATAEQTASASEQLSSQSEELAGSVHALEVLVKGHKGQGSADASYGVDTAGRPAPGVRRGGREVSSNDQANTPRESAAVATTWNMDDGS